MNLIIAEISMNVFHNYLHLFRFIFLNTIQYIQQDPRTFLLFIKLIRYVRQLWIKLINLFKLVIIDQVVEMINFLKTNGRRMSLHYFFLEEINQLCFSHLRWTIEHVDEGLGRPCVIIFDDVFVLDELVIFGAPGEVSVIFYFK